MSFHSFNQERFDKWKRAVERRYKDPEWDIYDADIQRIVNAFARFHLSKGNGYVGPRWQLIKAQLWVETSPTTPFWKTLPMQIGMYNDGGITDVCGNAHMPLVAPPEMRRHFDGVTIRSNPVVNIEAGMALLHLKMAFFASELKRSPQPSKHNQLAARHKQVSVHATQQRVSYISAWRPFCPVTLYQQYNIGDAEYAAKVNFCLELITS